MSLIATKVDQHTLRRVLQKCVALVKFTKADGSERLMKCTLHPNFIKKPVLDSTTITPIRHRAKSEHAISVWDIEAGAWRSFRFDSVIDVDIDSVVVENVN